MKAGSATMSTAMVKETAKKLGQSAAGAIQMFYSMYGAGKSVSQSYLQRKLLWERIHTLRGLRENAYALVQAERAKRTAAKAALAACKARSAALAGGTP